jgi:hypothetical protein
MILALDPSQRDEHDHTDRSSQGYRYVYAQTKWKVFANRPCGVFRLLFTPILLYSAATHQCDKFSCQSALYERRLSRFNSQVR